MLGTRGSAFVAGRPQLVENGPTELEIMRAGILEPSNGARLRVGALLAALLVAPWANAQELLPPQIDQCDTPAYPVGLDVGAQRVTALLRIDAKGRVQALSEAQGDERFVALVRESALDCTFVPATVDGIATPVDLPFAWDFPIPPVNLRVTLRSRWEPGPQQVELTVQGVSETLDGEGVYAVRNALPGTYEFRASASGWRIQPATVTLEAHQAVDVELWAVPLPSPENELVASYEPLAPGPSKRTIDQQTMRAVPGSLGDPLRALQTQPGFARTPFDAGWLLVRGGDFDDTGLYLDGVRIPLLFHMGGFTSVLHPELTDQVQFWSGAPPARYSATSGAVNVVPIAAGAEKRVVAGVNLAYAHAFANIPTQFGGIAIAARRSYLDGVVALALGNEAAAIAPRFWDGQVRANFGDSTITLLTLSDAFDAPSIEGGLLTVTQVGTQLQGRFPVQLGGGELVVSPWVATQNRTLTGDVSEEQGLLERFPGVRVEWIGDRQAPLRWDAGVETELHTWDLNFGPRVFESPGWRADPWFTASTGQVVVLESGLRLDTLMIRDHLPRTGLSPRTSVRWLVNSDLSLHTEWGRFHGPPIATLVIGVPEGIYLPLEESDLLSVGFRGRVRAWTIEGDLYERQMRNLAALEVDGTVGLLKGRARGVEAQVAWHPSEVPATVSVLYQLTQSLRRENSNAEPFHEFTSQPHRLQLLGVTHLPADWTLSGRFRVGSGFPRVLDNSGVSQPVEAYDLLRQDRRPVSVDPAAPRLASFHALDLKASRAIPFRKWSLDVYLDVQNVYNRRVAEPLITGFGESIPTYGFGLPVLPIFGVEAVAPKRTSP